jgi:biopolymer transport protein ExbB
MATLVKTAPLLGLFGTVVGMIKTFSLITTYGTANPVVLTGGITVSLLTTQAGLLVAFPCILFHNYVKNKKNALVQDIVAKAVSSVMNLSTTNAESSAKHPSTVKAESNV